MEIIDRFKTSVQKRGIQGTLMTLLSQYQFRLRFRQLDLWGNVNPPDMEGPQEVKAHATRYEPTNPVYFSKVFDGIDWNYPESTFIDFGCGKGATMVFAAGMNFRKVIGVEFCSRLSGIALRNMEKHIDSLDIKPEYEVVNTDAAKYEIPAEADCFYFFNPFDAIVLDKVMSNIFHSVRNHYRRILIIYLNAMHSQVIDQYPVKMIKHIPHSELDVYLPGGAYVYLYEK